MFNTKELVDDYVALARCCNQQAVILKRMGYPRAAMSYKAKRDAHMINARAYKGAAK